VLHFAVLTHHASAGYIAGFFSIHERTLHRRLRSCGTSFRELLEDSRCEIARQLLESSSMSIGEIATTLDYSDGSAFARAFSRHFGTAPSAWRDSHRQASP
jgi:AraC-like DNA-binding protein